MTFEAESRGAPDGVATAWEALHAGVSTEPAGFAEMIAALRTLQDRITGAAPPEDVIAEITRALADTSDRLEPYEVDERRQVAGRLPHRPGRGQALVPPFEIDDIDREQARGRVTYGRFYIGGNGAVHGGAISLTFDDMMGRLANFGGRSPSRTAYLHVDYRNVAPVGEELRIEATVEREEGRKRVLSGSLYHGDVLCAHADALFVQLLPGQP